MARMRKDEFDVLRSEQLRGAVTGLPRSDMVGHARQNEQVAIHLGEINRVPGNLAGAGVGEGLFFVNTQIIRMELRGQVGRIIIPEENVERGRVFPVQIIVDGIVLHQMIGPHPCEHAAE